MRKILIIGRKHQGENNQALDFARRLQQNISALKVENSYYEDIILKLKTSRTEAKLIINNMPVSITEFSLVIMINWSHDRLYTDLAHSLALICEKSRIKVWNEELLHARSSTKISQLVRVSQSGYEIPESMFSLSIDLLKDQVNQLGSVFIAKDPLASRGRRNYLINKWDDLVKKPKIFVPILFQEFIKNDYSDLRMFMVANKPKLAILRRGNGSTHLNNISSGGSASIVNLASLPDSLIKQTEKIAILFKRDLCGIDFIFNQDTGRYIFLEINTTPQISNGVFAEQKISVIASSVEKELS